MYWLIFALLSPVFFAVANIIDAHFTNNLFKKIPTLAFFALLTNLIFLPVIFFIDVPAWITFAQLPFFIILGLTGLGYLYPYYQALRQNDTSVVVSLFALGKIFIPVLAFLLVDERLTTTQYIGFLIIIISSSVLTMNGSKTLRPNASFFWMAVCTLILAVDSVVYKYVFTLMSWSTGFVWATLFSCLFGGMFLLFPKTRQDIFLHVPVFKRRAGLFILEELFSFAGTATMTLAISLASVTLVGAIGSLQPVVVLMLAFIFGRSFPAVFKEDISSKGVIKKVLLFVGIFLGVLLIV